MVKNREKYNILVMAILLAGACFLTYYFHAVLETGTVFTHLFYVPIVLASVWWKRKGLAVAIFLALLLIFGHFFITPYMGTVNDLVRASMFMVVALVTAVLSEAIAKEQEVAAHLNAGLRAVRNVSQLIAKEKDRDKLLKGVCESLIETRGCHSAWIALLDECGGLVTTAEAGLGKDFLPMVERLKRGDLVACLPVRQTGGRRVLRQSEVVVTKDRVSTCADCPLAKKHGGRGAMTVQLAHGGKVYGLLSVSISREITADKEEQTLFKEVSGDVAFALHNMELEEEHKRAEQLIRLSNAVKMSTDSIVISDLEGKIIEVNEATLQMYGTNDEGDLIGKSSFELIAPEDREKAFAGMEMTLEKGYVKSREHHIITKNGSRIPVEMSAATLKDVEGKPVGFVGISRDITERKRAEEALREREEKYRTILENIEDGYYEVDIAGNFTFFNDALCRLLGYPEDELMGMNNRQYVDEETAKALYQTFNEVYRTRKPTRLFDWEVIRKDGTRRFVEASVSLISGSTGEPAGFRGIVRDITERKGAEEELRRAYDELEEFADVAVGRELKMAKMEREMESLKAKLKELTSGQERVKG